MRVQFCRLNLSAAYSDYDEKDVFLNKSFYSNKKIKAKKFIWQIVDVAEVTEGEFKYYSAQLIKYDPKFRTEIFNETNNKIEEGYIPDKVEEKIPFMLERNSGLIVFQVSNHLHETSFQGLLKKIIERSNDDFFINAQFETIPNKSKFKDDLKKISDIKTVKITLHPSNPTFKPFYQKIDENLKEANIKSIQEKAFPADNTDGIRLEKYPDFAEKVQMTLDGYGKTEIKGSIDGKPVTIQTISTPYEKNFSEKDFQDSENKFNISALFVSFIKDVKDYIKNDQ